MQLDWKKISQSEGYKSLKASYIRDVTDKRSFRDKKELYTHFQWVIYRAAHYAKHTGKSIEQILIEWEESRGRCWWLNYYQEARQPLFHSNAIKPRGFNGTRKTYNSYRISKQRKKILMMNFINDKNKNKSTKEKLRWTAQMRKYR